MKNKLNKSVLRIGIVLSVITALLVGIALPALADNDKAARLAQANAAAMRTVQGKVTSLATDNTSFVVQSGNQTTTTVYADNNTRYFVVPSGKIVTPVEKKLDRDIKEEIKDIKEDIKEDRKNNKENGPKQNRGEELKELKIQANWKADLKSLERFGKNASFADIAVGDRVIARVQTSDNLAKQVLIIKAPVNRTIKGTITLGSTANTIVITPTIGSPVTLNVVASTRIVLKGITSVSGYAVAVYNSTNNNALKVNVQATAPAASEDED